MERRSRSSVITRFLELDRLAGVSGLADLVPLAEQLAAVAGAPGNFSEAREFSLQVLTNGLRTFGGRRSDVVAAAKRMLLATGCVTGTGEPNSGRIAELIAVCDVLAAMTPPALEPSPVCKLVLSGPAGGATIQPHEELARLVMSTIRSSTETLHLGGAFWNLVGFEQLNEWLLPAMRHRGVKLTMYVNLPERADHQQVLHDEIATCQAHGSTTVHWFTGRRPTLQHVKFTIADGGRGYLGTANLTSWGMDDGHIEAGVELAPLQAARLLDFFESLRVSGLFADVPPSIGRTRQQ